MSTRLPLQGHRVAAAAALLCSAAAAPVCGQSAAGALSQASLEELMNLRVTSVSRKEQKLSAAAAAVYVVTREEIRRSGATSIPEALRAVPGLYVARIDSSKWAISARGFNGRFANKMLVLIDGRSIYTNLYSGVFWDQHDVLLEDVERIEVVRGPGGTMWGANAVNGVINIITRKASDTQGTMLLAGGGNEDRIQSGFRHGGRIGERISYRAFGRFFNRAPMRTAAGGPAFDSWHQTRAGGRLDWEINDRDSLTLMGDSFDGRSFQRVATAYPFLTAPQRDGTANVNGGYALARWSRELSERSGFTLQAYANSETRDEAYARGSFHTTDLDFQQRVEAGSRHDVLWGAAFRSLDDHIAPGVARFRPPSRGDKLYSTFLQDDITLLADRLVLTLGSKLQHNSYSGFEVQPTARLLWAPNTRHSAWAAVSRAVRTPSRLDHDIEVTFSVLLPGGLDVAGGLAGDRAFRSESVVTVEAGYRRQVGRRVALDLALFDNHYRGLSSLATGELGMAALPVPHLTLLSYYVNGRQANSRGAEVAATWSLSGRWRLLSNYSYFRSRQWGAYNPLFPGWGLIGNVPAHQAQMQSLLDLPARLQWDVQVYRVGALRRDGVPAYTRVDTRLAWRFGERGEISGGVRNGLDPHHAEFVPEDFSIPTEVKRSIYLQILRRF